MSSRIFLAAIAFAVMQTGASAAGAPDAQAMAQAVTGFYKAHQSTTQDGIPDAKTRAKYTPFISPALEKLLADGDAAEDRYAKANKDSPPLIEGDLFSPNFEGITSFKVGACTADAKGASCKVALHYADAHPRPQDKPVDWTDTVVVVKTPAGWRVDDIGYGGNWDFGNHGRLTDTLRSAIKDSGN
jgi:hypothetical protein